MALSGIIVNAGDVRLRVESEPLRVLEDDLRAWRACVERRPALALGVLRTRQPRRTCQTTSGTAPFAS